MYTQQSIYIYAYKRLCQCVGKVYYPNVNCGQFDMLGPSFQKMTDNILLRGSLRPPDLEKNLKPCPMKERVNQEISVLLLYQLSIIW